MNSVNRSPRRRGAPKGLSVVLRALIVAAVPTVLVGNVLWLLASPTFVQVQYVLPDVPRDVPNLSENREHALGLSGARAIRPGGDGIAVLERARLADGTSAFSSREVRHMEDVRTVVGAFLVAWGIALVAAAASAGAVWRSAGRTAVARALLRGANITLAATLLLALAMAMDFGTLFATFHGAFFAGDSWRFPADSTLLQLYPKSFWTLGGVTAAVLVALQAVALRLLLRSKRLRR